tara:strand:- start:149 stop:370 length:222 start_codon:yes stop_codon:yes gene_type:complete
LCHEEHLADKLILFLAQAQGELNFTTSRISQPLLTNIWVVQQFLPVKSLVEGKKEKPGKITKLADRDRKAESF